LERLQKQKRNKKTRKVKSNQMTKSLRQINNERKQERIDNDEGNIGIITDERIKENQEQEIKRLTKVDDKLEQRIATLEKVLASHAKCIGEIRKICKDE
jgi:catalase